MPPWVRERVNFILLDVVNPHRVARWYLNILKTYSGIWADKESDGSDEEMTGLGGRKKRRKDHGPSLGGGISFVSGGYKEEQNKEDSEQVSILTRKVFRR